MADLLTTKQIIDLLKFDRTTIYRMLKDGRLKGIKVGDQWRFPKENIDELLSVKPLSGEEEKINASEFLPVHCIMPFQDMFAEIAQVGAITTDTNGNPLTQISNSCTFCNLILASKKGKEGCIASWKKLSTRLDNKTTQFVKCHAGLQYSGGRIEHEGDLAAMLVAGQFYTDEKDKEDYERIKGLAKKYEIDEEKLIGASKKIRVLENRWKTQLAGWLQKAATSFERVGKERTQLIKRIEKIASISNLSVENEDILTR